MKTVIPVSNAPHFQRVRTLADIDSRDAHLRWEEYFSGGRCWDGLNRYTYCHNNPVRFVDPTGNQDGDCANYGYDWPGPDTTSKSGNSGNGQGGSGSGGSGSGGSGHWVDHYYYGRNAPKDWSEWVSDPPPNNTSKGDAPAVTVTGTDTYSERPSTPTTPTQPPPTPPTKQDKPQALTQELVQKQLGLPVPSACAITSYAWMNNQYLKKKGWGLDTDELLKALRKAKGTGFDDKGDVLLYSEIGKKMTPTGGDFLDWVADYLSLDDVQKAGIRYYLEVRVNKANPLDKHYLGRANGRNFDPDTTTNNRWWNSDESSTFYYRAFQP